MNRKALKTSILEVAIFLLIVVTCGIVFTAIYTIFNIYLSPLVGIGSLCVVVSVVQI